MNSKLAFIVFAFFCTRLLAEPWVRPHVVYKPTFLTGYDSLTAGTGYIAKMGNEYVFLTAHHLFGPAAGLERDLNPQEAVDFAAALAACSMTDPARVVVSSDMLLIPSAKTFGDQDASHDVAAFRLFEYQGPSLDIAQTQPKSGEKIYLLARPRGEDRLRLLSAVVTRVSPNELEYAYDESGANLAGTSGAPLLNENGEVVGMNLGGGKTDGKEHGIGNPAASFSLLVLNALR